MSDGRFVPSGLIWEIKLAKEWETDEIWEKIAEGIDAVAGVAN